MSYDNTNQPVESKKTVIPKVWDYLTDYVPNPLKGESRFPDVDWKEVEAGLNELTDLGPVRVRLTVTQVVDWNMEPMTHFFHGVVVPAFQKKWNATIANEDTPYYSKDKTKDMLKAALLSDGFTIKGSSELTPQEYMEFLNACEQTYFNLFHETYDLRGKPVL